MAVPLRFRLYERAVANASALAPFMRAVHGTQPRLLREDFSGTAALARAWCGLDASHRAIAVDRDRAVTRWITRSSRLRVRTMDAARCRDRADIIAATNFAIGYFHTRASLLGYLRVVRGSLLRRGVFVNDLYGGEGCWRAGVQRVRIAERVDDSPRSFTYEWRQVLADPRTGLVHNTISFSWREGTRTRRIDDAFTYHWRVWSIPELRDAMLEAGFRRIDVYDRLGDAIDHTGELHVAPMGEGDTLEPTYVVYLAARK